MEFQSLPPFNLIEPERLSKILSQLKERGVENLSFASKGYRGVVFKGYLKGRPVAVKVKRSDTPKEVPLKEFNFLSHLFNLYGPETPAPAPHFATEDFVVMEWIEGKPFGQAFKEFGRQVVREALKSVYQLDRAGVEHSEVKGEKHLIFNGQRVKVIDFESAKFKEKPRNLLQFVGYHLIGKELYRELGLERGELLKLMELYKREPEAAFRALTSKL